MKSNMTRLNSGSRIMRRVWVSVTSKPVRAMAKTLLHNVISLNLTLIETRGVYRAFFNAPFFNAPFLVRRF